VGATLKAGGLKAPDGIRDFIPNYFFRDLKKMYPDAKTSVSP
jgi:hypothetical protein